MYGRLLERLQERDLRVLGKVRGVVDDHYAPGALERTEREILLHLADLLDRDEFPVVAAVLIHQPHHDADVRMRPVLDLAAGETPAAAAGGARLARAEKGLREPGRHRALADRSRAAELVRLGDVATDCLLAETGEEATLPDDFSQGLVAILRPRPSAAQRNGLVQAGGFVARM